MTKIGFSNRQCYNDICYQKKPMKKTNLLSLLVLLQVFQIAAQPISALDWAKSITSSNVNTVDDLVHEIVTDNNNNVYATGRLVGNSLSKDIFIAKYSTTGQLLWQVAIGGTGDDEGQSIKLDNNGNVWVTGTITGSVDFDPSNNTAIINSHGLIDIFLAKFDTSGNYLWAGAMGGTVNDIATDVAIHPITGNIWICGGFDLIADFNPAPINFTATSVGDRDIFFAEYDDNGDFLNVYTLGDVNNDLAMSIAFDALGNLHLAGVFKGTIGFNQLGTTYNLSSNNLSNDGFLAKFDNAIDLLWVNAIGSKTDNDFAIDVEISSSGESYLCGYFSDTCLFKTNNNTTISTRVASGVVDGYIMSFAPNGSGSGNLSTFGGGDYTIIRDLAVSTDDKIYAAGYSTLPFDAAPIDNQTFVLNVSGKTAFILCTDLIGNFFWASNISEGAIAAEPYAIHLDNQDGILVGGEYQGLADFDPTFQVKSLTSTSNNDLFIARYYNCAIPFEQGYSFIGDTVCAGQSTLLSATNGAGGVTYGWYDVPNGGTPLTQFQFQTPPLDSTTTYYFQDSICGVARRVPVAVNVVDLPVVDVVQNGAALNATATNVTYQWFDCNANQNISGETNQSFTPSNSGRYSVIVNELSLGCQNGSNCIDYTFVGIDDFNTSSSISVYPNPASSIINISLGNENKPIQYKVFDATGKLQLEGDATNNLFSIDVNNLAAGIYFLKISSYSKPLRFSLNK